jgi:hypothetical protein
LFKEKLALKIIALGTHACQSRHSNQSRKIIKSGLVAFFATCNYKAFFFIAPVPVHCPKSFGSIAKENGSFEREKTLGSYPIRTKLKPDTR